jgi:AcrR family transcriptional regulator
VTAETTPASGTRRERLRRRTMHELKRAALEEVRERGAVALSLRSVARRAGMSPAGVYRYVDSREGLLTLLIAEGYEDLGHHLEVALGEPPGVAPVADRPAPAPPLIAASPVEASDRLRAVALAYRHWAITHPNEFGLLFGDPIPGYEAPAGGPTVEGMSRVGRALARPVIEAWRTGRLREHPALANPELAARLAPMSELVTPLPGEVHARLLLAWGRLHGQVTLEVFGHHRWLFPDGCGPLYEAEIEVLLTDLLADPADPAPVRPGRAGLDTDERSGQGTGRPEHGRAVRPGDGSS